MELAAAEQAGRIVIRMATIPNQSLVPKAFEQFDEAGRMKPSAYYDRLVDVMEELPNLHCWCASVAATWWTATASGVRPMPSKQGKS